MYLLCLHPEVQAPSDLCLIIELAYGAVEGYTFREEERGGFPTMKAKTGHPPNLL